MIVEIAWLWLRFQPKSALTQWYQARFARGGLRMRRIGIVALAISWAVPCARPS